MMRYFVLFWGVFSMYKDEKIKELKEKSNNLPEYPGVYIMKNAHNDVIYVGKAKNLKNRVSQYFNFRSNHTEKVKNMVKNIQDFNYIITDSEYEALLLECNLIKNMLPKYNILLKDDKGYKYIEITDEKWPRINITYEKDHKNYKYIGPFLNFWQAKEAVDQAVKIFKLPTCRRNFEKKSKPCLNYYIKQCSAPCAGKILIKEYLIDVKNAENFLEKGSENSLKDLTKEMELASDNLDFERAAKIRDKIRSINYIKNKQKIFLNKDVNCDFIGFVNDESVLAMNVLKFDKGNLYDSENFIVDLTNNIYELKSEMIQSYYLLRERPLCKIFIDDKIENLNNISRWLSKKIMKNVQIQILNSGEKLKIIKMCKKNATEYLNKLKYKIKNSIILELKNFLSLKNIPQYIEAYDISNIQGKQNVGGMVVFKDGKPVKKLYKKFTIKTINYQNDYASMIEIIKRRFNRYSLDKSKKGYGFNKKPDLILIDGGIEHTKQVKSCIINMGYEIPVFGMIKDSKHKTRALTDDLKEINIKSAKSIFNFITNIQDEVHRFTLNYHKSKREKRLKSSNLLRIKGIGEKRYKSIMTRFKNIDRISNATVKELMTIPGITSNIAKSIVEYFKNSR